MVKFLFFLLLAAPGFASFYPPGLQKGDTIVLLAPASPPLDDSNTIETVAQKLRREGYRVELDPTLEQRGGYLAGSDSYRAEAIMSAWRDPKVKAIWCYRGGYGSGRLLDKLDYNLIRQNPKILIGMSDNTALLNGITAKTGLTTYLGPNAGQLYSEDNRALNYSRKQAWALLTRQSSSTHSAHIYPSAPQGDSPRTLRSGVAQGPLIGGNLSVFVSLVGTPYMPDVKGKILVLEEVNEEPYRIDRMLQQLNHAGVFDDLRGLILASWVGCKGKSHRVRPTLEEVFQHYFQNVPYPVLLGFPCGHQEAQATLPLNAQVELDASRRTLKVL